MRILIANDDGIDAPGIKVLAQHLRKIADVYIVAPLEERSTTGHGLSLNRPLRIKQVGAQEWGISGFPADCILLALGHILRDRRPDLVISGINSGANLGQDIFYSGTVAAAREASFHGIAAIAVSLCFPYTNMRDLSESSFATAAQFVTNLVQKGLHQHIGHRRVFNINVPLMHPNHLSGAKYTCLGFKQYSDGITEHIDPRSQNYYWIEGKFKHLEPIAGSDCVAVEEGFISLTHLGLDQSPDPLDNDTKEQMMQTLNALELFQEGCLF